MALAQYSSIGRNINMDRNKYGRKVKRTHNLYKRRKSPLRRTLEAVGAVVLIGGLAFLGYAAGKPLLEFFKNGGGAIETSSLEWKPEETSATSDTDTTSAPEDVSTEETTSAPEINSALINSLVAPDTALESSAALATFVTKAKADGYNSVVLELKNTSGYVRYKSNLDAIKDTDIVTGTMPLAQIKAVFDTNEMKLIAKLSTLEDSAAPSVIYEGAIRWADDSYAWLDARAENGGKQWLDPFREATTDYLNSIVAEICQAGISDIIYENTIYPEFKPYDETILSSKFFAADRYKALASVITSGSATAQSNGGKLYAEANLARLLSGYEGMTGTAEFLTDTSLVSDITVILTFAKANFGTELQTGTSTSMTLPAETNQLIKMLYSQAKRYTLNMNIIPCIDSTGMTESELSAAKTALSELNYENYMIK